MVWGLGIGCRNGFGVLGLGIRLPGFLVEFLEALERIQLSQKPSCLHRSRAAPQEAVQSTKEAIANEAWGFRIQVFKGFKVFIV